MGKFDFVNWWNPEIQAESVSVESLKAIIKKINGPTESVLLSIGNETVIVVHSAEMTLTKDQWHKIWVHANKRSFLSGTMTEFRNHFGGNGIFECDPDEILDYIRLQESNKN